MSNAAIHISIRRKALLSKICILQSSVKHIRSVKLFDEFGKQIENQREAQQQINTACRNDVPLDLMLGIHSISMCETKVALNKENMNVLLKY